VWLGLLPLLLAGCSSTSPGGSIRPAGDDRDSKGGAESYECTSPANVDDLTAELVDQIQLERDREGLPPLAPDETLCSVAAEYACRMIEGDFFAHTDPQTQSTPGSRVTAGGYAFYAVGENLAAGQRTVAEVVEQWMESPAHRANILDETWRATGVAVRTGGEYGVYWIQVFTDPAAADPDESPSG
jgi:uncharacterized protein YkwD